MKPLVFSIMGDDKPGLIESVADVLVSHDASWLESHISRMAGTCVGILHVSAPDEQAEPMTEAMLALSNAALSIKVGGSVTEAPTGTRRKVVMDIWGTDQPGIVRELARVLAREDVNIDELHTEFVTPTRGAARWLRAYAMVDFPAEVETDEIKRILDRIFDMFHLTVTLRDIPAQQS